MVNKRDTAQDEIEKIAHNHISVDTIDHFTRSEAENQLGMSWTNISDIYPSPSENIESLQNLRDALQEKDYFAKVDEREGNTCVIVQMTYDATERLM